MTKLNTLANFPVTKKKCFIKLSLGVKAQAEGSTSLIYSLLDLNGKTGNTNSKGRRLSTIDVLEQTGAGIDKAS